MADAKNKLMQTDETLTLTDINRELKEMPTPLPKPRVMDDNGQAWRRRCINELNAQLQIEERELEQLQEETSDVTAAMEHDYERVSLLL